MTDASETGPDLDQLQAILSGVGEGVTVQRADGTLAYANEAAARALGFTSADELVATNPRTIMERFDVLDESGAPFSPERFPGRRVLQGADEAEEVLRYRERATGSERFSIVKATAIRDAEGAVVYAVNLFRDVTALRRREEWQRFLADAGEILNASLDREAAASGLARLVVPQLADWCTVHITEGGELRLVALAHVDPARVQWAEEIQERYPPDPASETGAANVVRTGRAELYPEISDEMIDAAALDADHLDLLRKLALVSAMVVPLSARGRTFGALTFISAESGRRYGEDDLAQAEEFARRAALALDNAMLHHTAQEALRDAELAASISGRLHALTASLAEAATPEEVARVAVDEGTAALDAEAGAVFLLDSAGATFTTVAHAGYAPEVEADHASFSVDALNPVTEAARTGRPVVVTSGAELIERWPSLASDQGASGDEATIAQPIRSGEKLVGVLHVAFRESRTFAAWELAFVETLAAQSGQALARARLYERDHEAALALQQSLLPSTLPAAEGVTLGAHYVPAWEEAHVGGDWYDAVVLDDGTLAVSVGDVVGHGLPAATAMGQLRNAIRAYLLDGISPAQVLKRLNRYAASMGEGAFATAVVATLDPERTTWCVASAGHPPALLVADGGARFLSRGGPPVGSTDDFDYEQVGETIEGPGTLVLFTDGLVERRGQRLEDGLARLRRLVSETAAADAQGLVDAMLEGDPPADDVAVLVVEVVSAPFALELPIDASGLRILRGELRNWLVTQGLGEAECNDVVVAVSEAAANAIEHPRDPRRAHFRVDGRVQHGELMIRISDSGHWREQTFPTDRGRGLTFMREFMSEVEIVESDDGTEVILRRGLPSRMT